MEQQWTDSIEILGTIGAISTVAILPYKISQFRKKRPKFKIDPRSWESNTFEKDGQLYARLFFNVYVKNQSIEPNTLTHVHYVVWANPKKRTRTLTFGGNPMMLIYNPDVENQSVALPLSFNPNESKHLHITFEIMLTGSHDASIYMARERVGNFEHPKHIYKLLFKDTEENLFDDLGNLRGEKLIQVWWMLPGTFEALKRLNMFPYFWHVLKIGFTYLEFQLRRTMYFFGF